jgi:maltooligosyltrehalose trehalohydrolase
MTTSLDQEDMSTSLERRFAIGAELISRGDVSVRVWAPDVTSIRVVMDGLETTLERDAEGYFGGTVAGRAGSRYGFRLKGDDRIYPDPASRSQPEGPHGLSEVLDPTSYAWRDADWPGISIKGQVLYQLHVGTFTAEGTWASASRHLERLRDLGVTTIQMMPVAEFPGEFGWGYDGVSWWAPSHLYGRPDELRRFVDDAHQLGLGVILDVVYNHLGPDGNYLGTFSRDYFTTRYTNEWGEALNFDGPRSEHVRELVLANAEHWIREYHFDGFRLDATQQIFDNSAVHVLNELVLRARAAAGARQVVIVGENEPQDARLLRPATDPTDALDCLYNDDFHHVARVALTGIREAYYSDFRGTSQELLAAVKHGFLFQGQQFAWQKQRRGQPALDCPPYQFLHFLENHDQVANSTSGRRLCELSSPGQLRAMTALLLLGPATPLLFQGQETGSTAPFVYFADHRGELGEQVRKGRFEFLGQFARFRAHAVASQHLNPIERASFESCKLTEGEDRHRRERFWRLHQDLLAVRRADETIASQGAHGVDGAIFDDRSFIVRLFGLQDNDRLLVINLGPDLDLVSKSEPLVAPPLGREWRVAWSSEDPVYGGSGTPEWTSSRWTVAGHSALLLSLAPVGDSQR